MNIATLFRRLFTVTTFNPILQINSFILPPLTTISSRVAANKMQRGTKTGMSTEEQRTTSSTAEDDANGDNADTNMDDQQPVWDPVHQIYVGGRVPDAGVQDLITKCQGSLPIFGYGSLCWKPGGILADPRVRHEPCRAIGYQRCWCQKSTDHRGWPQFPGLVCTLLQDAEVAQLKGVTTTSTTAPSMTEGVLYTVPPELVQDCLDELDFREKGGYAREVIHVVLDDPNSSNNVNQDDDGNDNTIPAALYRGTVDNPAIWPRALIDPVYAAAVCAVAVGPSGPNTDYLHNLHAFLVAQQERQQKEAGEKKGVPTNNNGETINQDEEEQEEVTFRLARLVDAFTKAKYPFHFLYGCGSNQHNQLLLSSFLQQTSSSSSSLTDTDEVPVLTEILLATAEDPTSNSSSNPLPTAIYAGGGHSALQTNTGQLYLFGWNEAGQCTGDDIDDTSVTIAASTSGSSKDLPPMARQWSCNDDTPVQSCALGFSHTLVLHASGTLYAVGDNAKGQVTGSVPSSLSSPLAKVKKPVVPEPVQGLNIVAMAAGLFHSAAVTSDGHVIVWGGSKSASAFTWQSPLADKAVKVACGRKHTVALTSDGNVWSWGSENKYGQLGLSDDTLTTSIASETPALVEGPWTNNSGFRVLDIQTGWSHTVISVQDVETKKNVLYGWGRNDKGQLGLGHTEQVPRPVRLPLENVQSVSCGSEYTVAVIQQEESSSNSTVWACGWNEHGNLGYSVEGAEFSTIWKCLTEHLRPVHPPGTPNTPEDFPVEVAAGGAHMLAMRVASFC